MCQIDDDDFYNALYDRVENWTDDEETKKLYMKMYERAIDSGVFSENKQSIMEIVDNDFVNWCAVIGKGDCTKDEWKMYCKAIKNDEYDVSCESTKLWKQKNANQHIGYIEAYDSEEKPTKILVRYY